MDGQLDIWSSQPHGSGAFNDWRFEHMAFEHEAGRLRRAARRGTVFFTDHAEKERKNDNIEKIDIVNMLGRCTISLVETNKENGEEEWRAEGTDSDGRRIVAVVVIYEEVSETKVVTTWAKKE